MGGRVALSVFCEGHIETTHNQKNSCYKIILEYR